jgi:DNA-binding NarL/FixJ family response regulator
LHEFSAGFERLCLAAGWNLPNGLDGSQIHVRRSNGFLVELRATDVLLWTPVRIYRDGLLSTLRRDERIARVTAPADPGACRDALLALRPAVLVVDATGPEAVDLARIAGAGGTGVVVLGIVEHEREVIAFAEAGVAAYVTLDEPLERLLRTISDIASGDTMCSPRITRILLRHVAALAGERERTARRTVHLTRREVEILRLVGEGLTNKQIAAALTIELPTVKNHVHHILEKLGAGSRARAVALTSGAQPEVAVAVG